MARSGVMDVAAAAQRRRPRQAAGPVGLVTDLPSANHIIKGTADVARKRLTATERQIVNHVEKEDVVAIKVVASVGKVAVGSVQIGVIVAVVISVGKGVVRLELQSLRETMIHLRL